MGLHHKIKTDSSQTTKLIDMGRELTKLIREAVTADRHSRRMSLSAHPNRWTDAAIRKDDAVLDLREKLEKYAKEI